MKRIFSGVQPTGDLHLGNYFGAIKQFVKLQTEPDTECLFCVVDLHAITVPHDPVALPEHSLQIAAAYIASGIDSTNHSIFIQSHVPAHAELAWILNSIARMGWLERMTQFREKTGTVPPADLRDVLTRIKSSLNDDLKPEITVNTADLRALYDLVAGKASNAEKASVGLFTYPVLMAADILAYKSTHVPVGDDQKQHLNLARDIAQKFNNDYKKDVFPIPQAVFSRAARIMSLQDGTRKMSKSDPDPKSRISFNDTDAEISAKIRRATADTQPFPSNADEITKPEIENLITIYSESTGSSREAIFNQFGGKGYGDFKPALAEVVIALVSPIRNEMNRLLTNDRTFLLSKLARGAASAQILSDTVLDEVKEIVGLRRW